MKDYYLIRISSTEVKDSLHAIDQVGYRFKQLFMSGAFVSKKSLDFTARTECYLVNCFDRHLSSLQMDVHLTGIFAHLYLPTKICKKTIKTE